MLPRPNALPSFKPPTSTPPPPLCPPQSGADAEPFGCPPFDNPLFEDEDSEDEFGGCGMPSPDWGSAWSTDTKESTLSVGAAADCSSSSQEREFDGEGSLEGWRLGHWRMMCVQHAAAGSARWVLVRWVLAAGWSVDTNRQNLD